MLRETLALVTVLAGTPRGAIHPPDWPAVTAAARSYKQEPSDQNASRLYELIPTRQLAIPERPDASTAEMLYSLVPTLERFMFYGDPWATRLAFRLRAVSDAAFGEDLASGLGSLATNRPELFLRELQRSGGSCDPVISFDPDRAEQWLKAERQLRLSRLGQPVPAELETKRSECLRLLKNNP